MVNGPCCWCGHDPSCGLASWSSAAGTYWYCHDDTHSCVVEARDARLSGEALAKYLLGELDLESRTASTTHEVVAAQLNELLFYMSTDDAEFIRKVVDERSRWRRDITDLIAANDANDRPRFQRAFHQLRLDMEEGR